MSRLGWDIQEDKFTQNTVIGNVTFTNIIATLDPTAPRKMASLQFGIIVRARREAASENTMGHVVARVVNC